MTDRKPSYLWAAFTARPFGMPVPPNLFGLAAFGLLGAFLTPGFWLVGAGIEVAYLYLLSTSDRFRKTVDAAAHREDPADQRYRSMLDQLAEGQRGRQRQIEARAREILATLGNSPLMNTHRESLEQLVWLHLRLLAARQAIANVVATAQQESASLDRQEAQIVARLEKPDVDPELRRSLEQQKAVIDQRQDAHANAARRYEHVEAELQRIDQQIALIREQALLATNEDQVGASLDALAASFNEANHWLSSQRDLLGGLDLTSSQKLPASVLQGGTDKPPPIPQRGKVSQ